MEVDLARHIARCVFLSSRQLSELIPILKDNCSADEYQQFTKGIATVIAHMNLELMNKICAEHPQVEKEIEADMAKYGRFL
ncbi:MAG: hypothetical protein HY242_08075 [Afipia sp.]|nr:hypothetical protein [Afipia sp.]